MWTGKSGVNHLYSQPVGIRSKTCTDKSPRIGPLRQDAPSWSLAPFVPEGLLSSISAILSGTIGIHYGHVLIHFQGHRERLKHGMAMGLGLLVLAFILHFTDAVPLNRQLYSISYVCLTAGAAGIVFSAFYALVLHHHLYHFNPFYKLLQLSMPTTNIFSNFSFIGGEQIDIWGVRTPFLYLEWIGMNAMLVYVMAAQGIFPAFVNAWYYENPDSSLVHWIQKHVFVNVWHSERTGTLLYVIFAEVIFWGVVSSILHKLRIYWKL